MPASLDGAEILYQLAHSLDDRRAQLVVTNSVLFSLATVAVGLRLWARYRIKAGFQMDDYLMIVAMVLGYGLCASGLLAVHFGLGRHVVIVGLARLSYYLRSLFSYELLYISCLATVKISILLFYRRIFPTPRTGIAIYSLLACVVAWAIASYAIAIFQCHPISHLWHPDREGTCINQVRAIIAISVPNIFTEAAILSLPLPLIWRLQAPRPQRLALSAVFLLGGFACIASIVRTRYVSLSKDEDPTWTDVSVCLWSTVEACVGIISANLPIMRSFFNRLASPVSRLGRTPPQHSGTSRTGGKGIGAVSTQSSQSSAAWPIVAADEEGGGVSRQLDYMDDFHELSPDHCRSQPLQEMPKTTTRSAAAPNWLQASEGEPGRENTVEFVPKPKSNQNSTLTSAPSQIIPSTDSDADMLGSGHDYNVRSYLVGDDDSLPMKISSSPTLPRPLPLTGHASSSVSQAGHR